MQRASLLAYFDTLVEMGGDDVQQLCDAGEEEFLEIMALVGMARKPLHVRRFQKSLHEWLLNPSAFRQPLDTAADAPASPRSMDAACLLSVASPSPTPSATSTSPQPQVPAAGVTLDSRHVARLATAAQRLVRHLPPVEPSGRRKASRELEAVLSADEADPRRMHLIRKYSAIYGRFDCKRRPEKPLTAHEASVNEAAAQMCRLRPALLTRRDELFPLARQVVRDAGYATTTTHR